MENSVTFKPVVWRFIIWKFIPLCTGAMIVNLIFMAFNQHVSRASIIGSILGFLIGTIIGAFIYRERFEISIREGNISGPVGTWFVTKKTFSIADVDLSYRDQQSFYEKINFVRAIRSLSGQKILVTDFIYGRPVTDEIHRIAEQEQMQMAGG